MNEAGNAAPVSLGAAAERCDAAVLARMRGVAVILTVTGRLDVTSAEPITQRLCQFTEVEGPLIVDLSGVDVDHGPTLERLVSTIGAECHYRHVDEAVVAAAAHRDLQFTLVGSNVMWADSPLHALHYFAEAIRSRRHMSLWPSVDR